MRDLKKKTGKTLLNDLIAELKIGLDGVYGDRLKGLYLYGSYARGEEDDESDLDILVVLEQLDRYAAEVNRTGKLTSDLSVKHGITISPVFVRETEWLHGDTPFLSNVRNEAISL
jgi:predicted nucleotidyltransferase